MDEINNTSVEETSVEEESLFDDTSALDEQEGLFDDYGETSEAVEDNGEANAEEAVEEQPVENSFLHVKFNGEDRSLSEEEARTFAQKGMNYDRFYEPIERLARANNMSVGEYVNHLNDTQTQFEVENEMESMRENPKYADLDEDVLKEIAESRVRDIIGQRDKYYADQQREQAEAKENQFQREIDMFMTEYPEFQTKGPDALDPKVFEYVDKGYTLLEAYNKYQREMANKPQFEMKAKNSKLNEANRRKSLGNTSNAGNAETDAFLAGLE